MISGEAVGAWARRTNAPFKEIVLHFKKQFIETAVQSQQKSWYYTIKPILCTLHYKLRFTEDSTWKL